MPYQRALPWLTSNTINPLVHTALAGGCAVMGFGARDLPLVTGGTGKALERLRGLVGTTPSLALGSSDTLQPKSVAAVACRRLGLAHQMETLALLADHNFFLDLEHIDMSISIETMDIEAARAFFLETFDEVEAFRLMYPSDWQQNLVGDYLNKWIVCIEVRPRIQFLDNVILLRKLCTHVDTILKMIQSIAITDVPPTE